MILAINAILSLITPALSSFLAAGTVETLSACLTFVGVAGDLRLIAYVLDSIPLV